MAAVYGASVGWGYAILVGLLTVIMLEAPFLHGAILNSILEAISGVLSLLSPPC